MDEQHGIGGCGCQILLMSAWLTITLLLLVILVAYFVLQAQ